MHGRVVSVNLGKPRTLEWEGRKLRTGIFKSPAPGRVAVGVEGLEGDGQADRRYHGGPDKAVYAYCGEHYAAWSRELGRTDLGWGCFGENLTLEGFLEDQVRLGDRLLVGSGLLLEVRSSRVPCYKLGIRLDLPKFPKLFGESLRCGFYLGVLEPGEVGSGDEVRRVHTDPEAQTVRDSFAKIMRKV